MNLLEVKKRIKKKFGTMSNFARIAKIDRYDLQKKMAMVAYDGSSNDNRKILSEINRIATGLKVPNRGAQIPPDKLELLISEIKKSGGVNKFCDANPKFSSRSVFQILQGRRRKMSPGVQALFDHFYI